MPLNGPGPVLDWTIADVRSWLTELGMARYTKIICDQHKIDGPAQLMIQALLPNLLLASQLILSGARLAATSSAAGGAGRHKTPGVSSQYPKVWHGVS